jgi:hypothetical protein
MKKFIFTANVIALLLLVPAVLVGYLHNSQTGIETKAISGEVAKQATNSTEVGNLLRLVKTN